VSAIPGRTRCGPSDAVASSSYRTVHRMLGPRSNAVTRSSALDPHTLILDSIPNRNDRAPDLVQPRVLSRLRATRILNSLGRHSYRQVVVTTLNVFGLSRGVLDRVDGEHRDNLRSSIPCAGVVRFISLLDGVNARPVSAVPPLALWLAATPA
jgi:hypothetical protein